MRPIKDVLPHREPFLFLDEIVDLTSTSIIAKHQVRGEEPHFRGHYPGRPIMPGVLLCEAVLQAGAYLMSAKLEAQGTDVAASRANRVPVVTRLNNVKFKKMVKPGDTLEIHAAHERSMMGAHIMNGSIRCEGKLVASLEFVVMLADEAQA